MYFSLGYGLCLTDVKCFSKALTSATFIWCYFIFRNICISQEDSCVICNPIRKAAIRVQRPNQLRATMGCSLASSMHLIHLLFLKQPVSRKPRKLSGPIKPFVIYWYLKTDQYTRLKLLV